MKTCISCLIPKDDDQFDEGRNQCKKCRNKYARESGLNWKRNLKSRYNISEQEYYQLLEDQNGVCAICGRENYDGRRLDVDHDHSCCSGEKSCGMCVRGLLCGKCNKAIGALSDSIELLKSAITYLETR